MADAFLLLPDFVLILLGFVLCRWTALDRSLWSGVERLVYHVLFPALLFGSILKQPIQAATALPLMAGGLAITLVGIALAWGVGRLPGVDMRLHASGQQVAFRLNSYVALALAERAGGTEGVAAMAMVLSVCVPVCNVAAVWPLARQGGQGLLAELARNPLILATLGGLGFQALGWSLPEWALNTVQRLGGPAVPLGLMAVGAGLQIGSLRAAPLLSAQLLTIRHAVLPVSGLLVAAAMPGLTVIQQLVVVGFGALPTATSAYVLAARMGGNGPYVAGLVTVSTLLAMIVLPLTLAAWRALG
jgi:predicted permease